MNASSVVTSSSKEERSSAASSGSLSPACRAGALPQGVQEQFAGAGAQQVHRGGAAEGALPDAVQVGGLQLQTAAEGDDPQPGRCPGGRGGLAGLLVGVAEGHLGSGPAAALQRAARRLPQHLEHPVRPLGAGHRRGVVQGGLGAVDEGADGADGDLALLAERGQHALGVRHEQRRGRDDQDAARVPAPVLVEQIGGPVQRDGGLAGARPALDVGHGGRGGPDHQVLLGLDGGDDVAHGVAAGLSEGGHQGAVADDGQFAAVQDRLQLRTHQVVLDAEDATPLRADHPAPYDAPGVDGGRPVERRRGRCPPVDDQRGVFGVEDSDTADVERFGDVGGVVRADGPLGGLDGGVGAVGALLAVLPGEQVDPPEQEVLELVVEPVEVDSRRGTPGRPSRRGRRACRPALAWPRRASGTPPRGSSPRGAGTPGPGVPVRCRSLGPAPNPARCAEPIRPRFPAVPERPPGPLLTCWAAVNRTRRGPRVGSYASIWTSFLPSKVMTSKWSISLVLKAAPPTT